MKLFAIDTENTITAFAAAKQIPEGQEHFATEKELAKVSTGWPSARLVQIWNSFAGVAGIGADLKPVKKFTDRQSAIARIWKAIQALDAPAAPLAPPKAKATTKATRAKDAPKAAKRAKKANPEEKQAAVPREFSKKAVVIDMLKRPDGASLEEIMAATDWQKHSVRGFLSGQLGKRMGLVIESTKNDAGERRYRIEQ